MASLNYSGLVDKFSHADRTYRATFCKCRNSGLTKERAIEYPNVPDGSGVNTEKGIPLPAYSLDLKHTRFGNSWPEIREFSSHLTTILLVTPPAHIFRIYISLLRGRYGEREGAIKRYLRWSALVFVDNVLEDIPKRKSNATRVPYSQAENQFQKDEDTETTA
jgi:hypothetical protein